MSPPLPCSPVEDLLQDVQDLVGGPVLAVPLVQVVADGGLAHHALPVGRGLDDGLGAHATALGRKVNALTRALGDVTSGVSDERDTALAALGPGVLGNRVRFNTDDLAALSPGRGAIAGSLLVLLDGRLVDDGTGADGDMVVLGENPSMRREDDRIDVRAQVPYTGGGTLWLTPTRRSRGRRRRQRTSLRGSRSTSSCRRGYGCAPEDT